MQLKSDRLIIRELVYNDWYDYYLYASDPRVADLAGFKPISDCDVARNVVTGLVYKGETYTILEKESKKFIGTLSLYLGGVRKTKGVYTLGISLAYNYWHFGYAREALQTIIEYAFKFKKANYLEIMHEPRNVRSKKMIEAVGFIKIAEISDFGYLYNGRPYDICLYSLGKGDYDEKIIRNEI